MSIVFSRSHKQINNIFNERNAKTDYLIILNDIDSILSNVNNLSNNQKLEYCNSQRYYIKLYLREVLK